MKASIKKKLQLSFTFIFLILTGSVCLFWRKAMSDMAEERAISHFAVSVNAVNDEMDNLLKDASYISLILSFHAEEQSKTLTGSSTIGNYSQLESQRAITRSVSDFYSYRNYISSILLVGENGNEFSNGVTLPTPELKRQPWFSKLDQDEGKGVFIRTHSNYTGTAVYKTSVISVGRRLFDNDQPIGYLLVDLSYDYVKRRFEAMRGNGGILLVFDEESGLIYNSNSPNIPEEALWDTDFCGVLDYMAESEGRFHYQAQGKNYMVLYKTSDFTGWTSMFLIPRTVIMEDINAATRMILGISTLLLIAGVLLIGYFSRYLTRNILNLKGYVDRMEVDHLKEIPTINSGDEIEQLDASFNHLIRRIKQLMSDVEERRQKEKNAEFQALYAQISPHFLSNTLNTIRWMADRQNVGNISELTTSLITLLQYSMNNKKEVVSLEEEIEYIKNYLVLQEYRYYGMFDVRFVVEEEVKKARILKFMIQPLVENAIIHGISGLEKQGKILIRARKTDNHLEIMVADNGAGFSEKSKQKENRQHKTHGIGLDNINQRIDLFYGKEYFLKIDSRKNYYTKAVMVLPLLYGKEEIVAETDDSR